MEILNNILTILGYVGIVWSTGQWLYYNKIKFFLFVNQRIYWRKDVNFELTIISNSPKNNISEITKFIRNTVHNETKIISKSAEKVVFTLDTLTFQVTFDPPMEEEGEYELQVYIKNTNSTYNTAKKNLHTIGSILEDLKEEGLYNPTKFQFVSSFKKKNPFIGQSVSTVSIDNVKQFMMVLSSNVFKKIAIENDNDIQIGLNNISYVDKKYSEIKLIAEIILAF